MGLGIQPEPDMTIVDTVLDWAEKMVLGGVLVLGVVFFTGGCTKAQATDAPSSTPQLNWTVIDASNGWYIETACATDGIRLFRHQSNAAITAVADHTCDK